MDKEERSQVCGYQFVTEADTDLARQEEQRVALLELKLDYENLSSVAMLYEKAIRNQVFVTPVGIAFLHKLQLFLQEKGREEGNIAIPVAVICHDEIGEDGERATIRKAILKEDYNKKLRQQEKKMQGIRGRYRTSFAVNVLLVILLIVLFVITLTGENANVINYRRVITNQYAAWDAELSEREKAVKQKEKELDIDRKASSQF